MKSPSLREARRRWLAGRRAVSAANRLGDPAARAFAMGAMQRRRADYHRAIRVKEAWLAGLRRYRKLRELEARLAHQ